MKQKIEGRMGLVKRLVFFSLIFFSLVNAAEPANMGKESFERLVDYVNTEVTIRYLETLTQKKDQDNLNELKAILPANTIDIPVDYSSLEDQLKKHNFERTLRSLTFIINERKLVYDPYLSDQDLIREIFETRNFPNLLLSQINIILSDVHANLLTYYLNKNEIGEDVGDVDYNNGEYIVKQEAVGVVPTKPKDGSKGIYNVYSFIGIILIMTVFFVVFYTIRINQLKTSNYEREKRNKTDREKELIKMRENINRQYDVKVRQYEEMINKLRNEIYDLKRKSIVQNRELSHQSSESIRKPTEGSYAEKQKEVVYQMDSGKKLFYMGAPSKEGFFLESKKESHRTGMSMYRFEQLDSFTAKFWFDGDEISTNDAIRTPHIYLEPVCEMENKVFSSAKKLRTVKEGIVQLYAEQWKCLQKAILRYE